jgi:hypothetical protein
MAVPKNTREVQSISDLHKIVQDNSDNNKAAAAAVSAFLPGKKISQMSTLDNELVVLLPRTEKESSCSSTETSETTDQEEAPARKKVNNIQNYKSITEKISDFKTKLSTKAVSDSNFNAVKLKRWSDYRASWHQHQQESLSSIGETNLSRSELVLSSIGKDFNFIKKNSPTKSIHSSSDQIDLQPSPEMMTRLHHKPLPVKLDILEIEKDAETNLSRSELVLSSIGKDNFIKKNSPTKSIDSSSDQIDLQPSPELMIILHHKPLPVKLDILEIEKDAEKTDEIRNQEHGWTSSQIQEVPTMVLRQPEEQPKIELPDFVVKALEDVVKATTSIEVSSEECESEDSPEESENSLEESEDSLEETEDILEMVEPIILKTSGARLAEEEYFSSRSGSLSSELEAELGFKVDIQVSHQTLNVKPLNQNEILLEETVDIVSNLIPEPAVYSDPESSAELHDDVMREFKSQQDVTVRQAQVILVPDLEHETESELTEELSGEVEFLDDCSEPELEAILESEVENTLEPKAEPLFEPTFEAVLEIVKEPEPVLQILEHHQRSLPRKPRVVPEPVELKFNDYMISFLPGLCYEVLYEEDELTCDPCDYSFPLVVIEETTDSSARVIILEIDINDCCPYLDEEQKNEEVKVWREIPIIVESHSFEQQVEITELSSGEEEDLSACQEVNLSPHYEEEPDLIQRSLSADNRQGADYLEIIEILPSKDDDSESFATCSEVDQDDLKHLNIPTSFHQDLSQDDKAQVDTNLDDCTGGLKTSLDDITLSQDSLALDHDLDQPESPDVNKEVEKAFENGSIVILEDKGDSGNHTQTTEFETTTSDDSEDEFEQLRARRMRAREAAPPERDIFEDDTENADFQLKLRHLNNSSSNCSMIQATESLLLSKQISGVESSETITESVSIEASTEGFNNIGVDLKRSRSQELFAQRQQKKFQLSVPEFSMTLEEQPEQPVQQVTTSVNEEEEEETNDDIAKSEEKQKEEEEEELLEEEESEDNVSSAFPIMHSRSFDSGLLPLAPDLNRLLKAASARHLSSQSSSIQSIIDRRSSNTTTPSPRKQSIENLASSVENLKEKLLLIPKDSAETIEAVKQRLSRPAMPSTINSGSLSRSSSWQGFSAAHRTSRQQAFWDCQRYESVSDKDLALPPPPDKIPEVATQHNNRPPEIPGRIRSSASSPNRIGSRRSSSRRYRPLSQSPSSSPARHHLRLSHLIPSPKERSSSLEGVDRVPRLPSRGTTTSRGLIIEKAGSTSALNSSVECGSAKLEQQQGEKGGLPASVSLDSLVSESSPIKNRKRSSSLRSSTTRRRRNRSTRESADGNAEDQYLSCSSSSSGEDSDDEYSYSCVVMCNADDDTKNKLEEEDTTKPENMIEVQQVRTDLSPERIQQLMAAVHNIRTGNDPGENAPTEQEIQDFLDYVGQGVINDDDHLEYERQRQELEEQDLEDSNTEDDVQKRNNKSANQYFYRPHYLSIIQEEEEHSECNMTPSSSRASSRPGSMYGMTPGLAKAFKEYQDCMQAKTSKEQSPALGDSPDRGQAGYDQKRSPKIGQKTRKTDSIGSELSLDSLASVNSILSDEGSSCITYSSLSTRKSKDFDTDADVIVNKQVNELPVITITRKPGAPQSLSHLLDNVPPPPKCQPPALSPELQANLQCSSTVIQAPKKKVTEVNNVLHLEPGNKKLTSLEKQLSEIEKHVVQRHKQTVAAEKQVPHPATVNTNTAAATSQNNPFNSSPNTVTMPSKFSMREMLKNVVSSQKNVPTKKIQQQPTEQGPKHLGGKMGKFFKSPFQSLAKSNPLSKSTQSLSQSKDSLATTEVVPEVARIKEPTFLQKQVQQRRSKSLSGEVRTPILVNNSGGGGSESGPSSGNSRQKNRAVDLGQNNSTSRATRWLGKNPFETDKSPATEVLPVNLDSFNPFILNSVDEPSDTFSGISTSKQQRSTMVGTKSVAPQRGHQKASSTLGEQKTVNCCRQKETNSVEKCQNNRFSGRVVLTSQEDKGPQQHRVLSAYENVTLTTRVEQPVPPVNSSIAALIKECEEYVKTEEFTKDLSSQILNLFMQETKRPNNNNSNLLSEAAEFQYDVPAKLVITNNQNNHFSRDSLYENKNEHETSPDSSGGDSAYDSDKKRCSEERDQRDQTDQTNLDQLIFTAKVAKFEKMSKSSSLNLLLTDSDDDNISNASTIKNAVQQFRDENISYDTVLRKVVAANIHHKNSRLGNPIFNIFAALWLIEKVSPLIQLGENLGFPPYIMGQWVFFLKGKHNILGSDALVSIFTSSH